MNSDRTFSMNGQSSEKIGSSGLIWLAPVRSDNPLQYLIKSPIKSSFSLISTSDRAYGLPSASFAEINCWTYAFIGISSGWITAISKAPHDSWFCWQVCGISNPKPLIMSANLSWVFQIATNWGTRICWTNSKANGAMKAGFSLHRMWKQYALTGRVRLASVNPLSTYFTIPAIHCLFSSCLLSKWAIAMMNSVVYNLIAT